jgi:CRP-like cAMP-binding protein
MEPVQYPAGKSLTKEKEAHKYCYLIDKGEVRVRYSVHSNMLTENRPSFLSFDLNQPLPPAYQYIDNQKAIKKQKNLDFVVDISEYTYKTDVLIGILQDGDFILEENLLFGKMNYLSYVCITTCELWRVPLFVFHK